MLKVLVIFGTRPEAIKMAPVVQALQTRPDVFAVVTCAAAQHREMLDQVLELFGIAPDIDLNLMRPGQTLEDLTARAMTEMSRVLAGVQPDVLLVQGDTTTVMAAALAAFYKKITVGHVEAGLRTRNLYAPFPEEMNRRMVSVLSTYHFAPTDSARSALVAEGAPESRIFVTGNTVIDALYFVLRKPVPQQVLDIEAACGAGAGGKKLVLVTAHRRENFGGPLENICRGMLGITAQNPDAAVVFPVHLNPEVRRTVQTVLGNRKNILLTEPVAYDVMAHLMHRAYLVVTDSGGLQEEAPALGTPVLVMRSETERPESVACGCSKVIGTKAEAIVREVGKYLDDEDAYRSMAQKKTPYGDGHAAAKIVDVLHRLF